MLGKIVAKHLHISPIIQSYTLLSNFAMSKGSIQWSNYLALQYISVNRVFLDMRETIPNPGYLAVNK
jgi:hypothetical protein